MPEPAHRLANLPAYPFAVINQRVAELKAQGHDVINLDVGSPDLPPPELAVETLSDEARRPTTHGYSGYRGTADFRASVARYYDRRFGVSIDPDRQVLPLLGSKEGIVNLCLAYLDRGDFALVPDIGYPAYSLGALLANAGVQWLPVGPETGYLPRLEDVRLPDAGIPKLMWVNYPNNPTGAVAPLAYYQQAVDFCREHNLLLASDNPYVDVTYDGFVAASALQADGALDQTVEFISFSKTFNMAGWRLGAAVGSPRALDALLKVKSNVDSGHFAPIYASGAATIDETPESWIAARNAVYQRRRDRMLQALPAAGLEPFVPKGALYIWARVTDPRLDGAQYVEQALVHAHVSMAPGAMYGPGGASYVRLSVCTPEKRLDEALDRLCSWYERR